MPSNFARNMLSSKNAISLSDLYECPCPNLVRKRVSFAVEKKNDKCCGIREKKIRYFSQSGIGNVELRLYFGVIRQEVLLTAAS